MKLTFPKVAAGLLLFLFSSGSSSAQNFEKQIDSIFSQFNLPDSPGVSVGVIHNGQFIFEKGYGMEDIAKKKQIDAQTNFDIGSLTKQFTALSILLLEEQGKLKRTDDIRKYLNDFPDYGHIITINHLLHMTSGIRDYLALEDFLNTTLNEKCSTEEYRYNLIVHQSSLNFTPGEDEIYSNSNYFLLGLIIEKVSGTTWENFVKENIFKPLGMKNTFFNEDENVPHRAKGYFQLTENKSACAHTHMELTGHGGIESNLEDLFIWDQNFYHNQLGKSGQLLIDKLIANDTLNDGEINYYANGIACYDYYGMPVCEHTGSWLAFNSAIVRFPEEQLTVICLSNYAFFDTDLAWKVADLYLHISENNNDQSMNENNITDEFPKSFCGLYVDSSSGHYDYKEISMKNGELIECASGNNLDAIGDNNFVEKNGSRIKYQFSTVNGKKFLAIYNSLIPDTFFQKNLPAYDDAFTGKYISHDLYGLKTDIKMKDGKPYFVDANNKTSGERFEMNKVYFPDEEITIEFKRNEKGEVIGFYASVDRARKLWFEKK